MDESKPSIPPSEFRLQSAEWTSADIVPPPAELAKSDSSPLSGGKVVPGKSNLAEMIFTDGPSVAVYYRNREEVSQGFLIALTAMGNHARRTAPEADKASDRKG